MIYIDNVTWAQSVRLPLYATPSGTSFALSVKRTTTTSGGYVTLTTSYTSKDSLFVTLNVTLSSGMADGEYEYRLMENGSIVGGGIIAISGAVFADKEYEQDITYKEYEANNN